MPSRKAESRAGAHLDLERDLPTTDADVVALRRLRYPKLSAAEYLRFLRSLPPPNPQTLRDRPGPRGEPFVLT